MTDIVERPPAYSYPDTYVAELRDEIERLRTRLAIQFGMHPGGDLAKATSTEIERLRGSEAALQTEIERLRALSDKLWTEHLIERENLKAEITRLSTTLKDNNHAHDVIYEQQLAEIGRLMALNDTLQNTVNAQSAAIERADRLVLACEQHLRDAKHEITKLREDMGEAGLLR